MNFKDLVYQEHHAAVTKIVMKIKSILIIIIILISPIILSAQTKDLNIDQMGKHLMNDLYNNYHPDSVALSKFCKIGCVFVKFKVNEQGEIANLSFSGDVDSTQFIIGALTKSVQSLKQDAELINFLKKSGRTIIQPFMYNYQAGCNFPEAGVKSNTEYFQSYLYIMLDLDHSSFSLFNMLKFKDGNMPFFDGILLPPFEVNNVVMH